MLVSVVIPTFNRPELTLRAVRSVLAQSHLEFELIVVDDGSSCEMGEVRRLVSGAGHRFVRSENRGVSAARNLGVRCSGGEWIAFLDSDDEWLEEKLARQVEVIESHRGVGLIHCEEIWYRNGVFVNPGLRHAKARGCAFDRSLELCCISPSSVLVSRELFERKNGFDEDMRVCEDYDLWLRICADGEVFFVEEPLVKKYGGHPDQLSRAEPAMDRFRIYSLLKLLRNGALSAERVAKVREMLAHKAKVVSEGAAKRGLEKRHGLFDEIRLISEETGGVTFRGLDNFISRVRNEIMS